MAYLAQVDVPRKSMVLHFILSNDRKKTFNIKVFDDCRTPYLKSKIEKHMARIDPENEGKFKFNTFPLSDDRLISDFIGDFFEEEDREVLNLTISLFVQVVIPRKKMTLHFILSNDRKKTFDIEVSDDVHTSYLKSEIEKQMLRINPENEGKFRFNTFSLSVDRPIYDFIGEFFEEEDREVLNLTISLS